MHKPTWLSPCRIEGEAAMDQAKLKAEAMKIEPTSELERLTLAREAEMNFVKEQNNMDITKARDMLEIEVGGLVLLFVYSCGFDHLMMVSLKISA